AETPRLKRLVAFGVGGLAGLAPLLLFDWWAFRNPLHTPYSGAAVNPGAGGVELAPGEGPGFFSLHPPSARVASELLLSQRGLLVVVAAVAAVAGTRLPLARRDLLTAAAGLVAWLLVEHGAPELLRVDRSVHQWYGVAAAILLVAAAAWSALHLRPEGLPLLA